MRFILFYHSLLSDWNHGNAHFLRGVASELIARNHQVVVYEQAGAWSYSNLVREQGQEVIADFHRAYPTLDSKRYGPELDLREALQNADVVLVHEWTPPELVRQIGLHHRDHPHYRLLFHDTHHRAVSALQELEAVDLSHFDGVLANGDVLRDIYLDSGWIQNAWTWHEAADTRLFHPREHVRRAHDLVWIGNWGDGEPSEDLREFLFEPISTLSLDAAFYGVRFPEDALASLQNSRIDHLGWLPNFRVPEIFAQYRVTVHVPHRASLTQLSGIPTIRPFEALACGIPLICARLEDCGGLFKAGEDFLVAHDGREMKKHLQALLLDKAMAREIAAHGRCTLLAGHTCGHRVSELLAIVDQLRLPPMVLER